MNKLIEANNKVLLTIKKELGQSLKGISDGYHTFEELYNFRLAYNILLFNEWASLWYNSLKGVGASVFQSSKYNVHKSWKHNDGEWCFGEEKKWFIVVAELPTGQITNHYKAEHWDKFKIPETEKALLKFDGHTSQDCLNRMLNLINELD